MKKTEKHANLGEAPCENLIALLYEVSTESPPNDRQLFLSLLFPKM